MTEKSRSVVERGIVEPMRAYLVREVAPVAPFDRPARECIVGTAPLSVQLDRSLAAAGIALDGERMRNQSEPIEGPALVVADNLWVSPRAMRTVAKAIRTRRPRRARFALPPSRFLDLSLPLQRVGIRDDGGAAFDLAYVGPGERATVRELFALGEDEQVVLPYREIVLDGAAPRHILGRPDPLHFPLTSTTIVQVRHWVHLLRISHFFPAVALLEALRRHPARGLWMGLRSLRPSRDATLAALRANVRFRGRNVRVHPSAVVEGSVLEDDVVIGPHASVIGSVVGRGSVIEDRAHLNQCTLGPDTFVSRNSSLSACAIFGDTDPCINGAQGLVIAERCGLTSFARPLDMRPGAEVEVIDNGKRVSAGELLCGVAFGPDTFVGADVTIAAGRAIPAGARLLSANTRTLSSTRGIDGPGRYLVENGHAHRLDPSREPQAPPSPAAPTSERLADADDGEAKPSQDARPAKNNENADEKNDEDERNDEDEAQKNDAGGNNDADEAQKNDAGGNNDADENQDADGSDDADGNDDANGSDDAAENQDADSDDEEQSVPESVLAAEVEAALFAALGDEDGGETTAKREAEAPEPESESR